MGRRADSARRRQREFKPLNDATNDGDEISGSARRAGVDRSFLYRHRDLLEQIHVHGSQAAQRARRWTGRQPGIDTGRPAQRSTMHRPGAARVQQLEHPLSEVLGEQAWHDSGLGAPDHIDQLKHQVVTLEQHTVDLRLQLEERDQDRVRFRVNHSV